MASITIRNLDDELKARLRMEAAAHGHSMEEEARMILRRALRDPEHPACLGSRIRQRFSALGEGEPELPERTDRPRDVDFGG